MDLTRRIAENRIAKAIDAGEFRSLRGRGKPFDRRLLEADDGSGWWAANHILEQAGMRPLWIELDMAARKRQLWAVRKLELARRAGGGHAENAVAHFKSEIDRINLLIERLNWLVPADSLKRAKINPLKYLR